MERHRCKLCLKSFANGRALGGHMRSHMLNLPVPQKLEDEIEFEIEDDDEEQEQEQEEEEIQIQLSQGTESASSSSSEEDEEDREEQKEILYGLRENPKRSIKMVDPEFSSVVLLQDRESETESSKNPTRRRSKRTRKEQHQFQEFKKLKFTSFTESWTEPEQPVSSVSDATTEEDVAFCLMMLSRDKKWRKTEQKQSHKKLYENEEDDEDEEETEESDDSKSFKIIKNRGKYKCETCNKVFKSYQALGGHRASHKKLRLHNRDTELGPKDNNNNNVVVVSSSSVVVPAKKVHECPYCFRVFSSGQALGGHKRSHVTGVAATATNAARIVSNSTKIEAASLNLIDLNLPAPVEEDVELSAVSDAEFVNHIKR